MSGPKCNRYTLTEERKSAELRSMIQEFEENKRKKQEEEKRKKDEEERQQKLEAKRRKEEERQRRQAEEKRLEEERIRKQEEERLQKIEEERRLEEERIRKQEEERQRKIEEERQARIDYLDEISREDDDEYERMLAEMYEQRQQEIISSAIDEAMEELGYELVAESKPVENAKVQVQAQVYSFSEGVGVQVVDANGRISMEVVGLGSNDRIPTESESEYLKQQMEDFCEAFDRLEEKLEEKGIVKSSTIHKLPPDKRFARVLNMESMDRKKEVDTLQTVMKQNQIVAHRDTGKKKSVANNVTKKSDVKVMTN